MKFIYLTIFLFFLSGCATVELNLNGLWKSNKDLTKDLNINYQADKNMNLYHFIHNKDFYLVYSENKIPDKDVFSVLENNLDNGENILIKKHKILKVKYHGNNIILKLLDENYNIVSLNLTMDNDCYTYHVDPSINFGKEFHEVFCKIDKQSL